VFHRRGLGESPKEVLLWGVPILPSTGAGTASLILTLS
jgi:hypothetical protein